MANFSICLDKLLANFVKNTWCNQVKVKLRKVCVTSDNEYDPHNHCGMVKIISALFRLTVRNSQWKRIVWEGLVDKEDRSKTPNRRALYDYKCVFKRLYKCKMSFGLNWRGSYNPWPICSRESQCSQKKYFWGCSNLCNSFITRGTNPLRKYTHADVFIIRSIALQCTEKCNKCIARALYAL